jgi:hypothetical protein
MIDFKQLEVKLNKNYDYQYNFSIIEKDNLITIIITSVPLEPLEKMILKSDLISIAEKDKTYKIVFKELLKEHYA